MKSLYQYILEHLTISIMENEITSKYKKFEEFVNNAKNDIDKHKKSIEFFKNLKNSLRLTLRSLLMTGCEVNVNNFNHVVNGKPSARKQKTECVRGNFGPDLETSKNVINFILKEKFYLTDKDFTISDFVIHPNVSSNSKPSCEIRFNNEVFYVCNNKISSNNETIIFTSKNFLINNLVDANHIYDKEELIKTVNTKLEKTQWYSNYENYGQWLLNLFKSIDIKQQIKTIDELNQLFGDNKKIEIPINDLNIVNTYNTLDTVSKNNIKTILGELICAIEINQLTNKKVGFPGDHSNMFYDFYVEFDNKEKINISVKNKSSNVGHPIEIQNIIPADKNELANYTPYFKHILELFDRSYESSEIIKGMKIKNDGNFASSANVLNNVQMNEIVSKVDEQINKCINKIDSCNFNINPKILNNKNISCEYCKYKDLCYMSQKDVEEIILQEVEDDEVDE